MSRKPGYHETPNIKNPMGLDLHKNTPTTRTFTAKVKYLNAPIFEWYELITLGDNPGDICEKYIYKKKRKTVFKNCFNAVVLDMGKKKTTVKICKNGSFQFTGCRDIEACEFCLTSLLNLLSKIYPTPTLDMTIIPVMTNIKFTLGYEVSVDRALKVFNNDFSKERKFLAYRTSGSPALNIKKKMDDEELKEVPVLRATTELRQQINLNEYIEGLAEKDQIKYRKNRYITLLLFRSGNVILSGMYETVMEKAFLEFQTISLKYRDEITCCEPERIEIKQ